MVSQHREIVIIISPKTGSCPNYSRFKPSKYCKYYILMTVPIRKSGFIKKCFFCFLRCRLMFCIIFGQKITKIPQNVHCVHASTLNRIFSLLKRKTHLGNAVYIPRLSSNCTFSLFCQPFSYRFGKDCSIKVTEIMF